MFDINGFKKKVKAWVLDHPEGDVAELIDFCEEQIPPAQFAANKWLIEQTTSWYKHVLQNKRISQVACDGDEV